MTVDIAAPYSRRLSTIRHTLTEAGLDALVVTHPPNLRYLTGFDGSLGALIVSRGEPTLIVDGRYITAARDRRERTAELHDLRVELADRTLEDTITDVVRRLAPSTVGVEAAAVTVSRFNRIAESLRQKLAPPPELKPTEGVIEQERIVKDVAEIGVLREAARRLSVVARAILSRLPVGASELEVASDVEVELRRQGFQRPAFDTIVASGPNAALPHARPGPRRLQPGDGVVLDFGGIYDGYCVDLTRTVQLAPESEAFGRLFDAVRAAHDAAIEAVAPGRAASEVDRAARSVLDERGFGEAFVHGTGHGLGLEIHEEPRLTKPGSGHTDQILRPGMVFTIEPGAYVPGLGGVRLEDDVLVLETGCEVLTDVPIDRTCTGS